MKEQGKKQVVPPQGKSNRKKWMASKEAQPTIIELECGVVATIHKAKAKDIVAAQRLMGSDESLFIPAMMSLLTELDGEKFVMEVLIEEMDGNVYQELMGHFSEINFPQVGT